MQNKESSRQQHPLVLWAKKYLLHNWPWKLLSFGIAVLLWGALITQDASLTREKTFNDISLTILNSDTLRRNGFVVVSGLDDLPTIKMTADVPQRMYSAAAVSNYNPRIDLSKIKAVGQQTIPITTSSTTTYGAVSDLSIDSVTVTVEEYITRSRIPVRLTSVGEVAEGLYAEQATTDPLYVTISGPKSLVNNVSRCVVEYDLSLLRETGTERTAVPFKLVDRTGKEISGKLIDVTSESVLLDSIMVEQDVYTAKSLPVNTAGFTVGSPAAGYVVKSITVSPAELTVAATDAWFGTVDSLRLANFVSDKINVENKNSTIYRNVRIVKSQDVAYFSQDTLQVTVEIVAE